MSLSHARWQALDPALCSFCFKHSNTIVRLPTLAQSACRASQHVCIPPPSPTRIHPSPHVADAHHAPQSLTTVPAAADLVVSAPQVVIGIVRHAWHRAMDEMEHEWAGFLNSEASQLSSTSGGIVGAPQIAAAAEAARAQALDVVTRAQLHLVSAAWDEPAKDRRITTAMFLHAQNKDMMSDILRDTVLASFETAEVLCPVVLEAAHLHRQSLAMQLERAVRSPAAGAPASTQLLLSPTGGVTGVTGEVTPQGVHPSIWEGWWRWLRLMGTTALFLDLCASKEGPHPDYHAVALASVEILLRDTDLLHSMAEWALTAPGVQAPVLSQGGTPEGLLEYAALGMLGVSISLRGGIEQVISGAAQQTVDPLLPPWQQRLCTHAQQRAVDHCWRWLERRAGGRGEGRRSRDRSSSSSETSLYSPSTSLPPPQWGTFSPPRQYQPGYLPAATTSTTTTTPALQYAPRHLTSVPGVQQGGGTDERQGGASAFAARGTAPAPAGPAGFPRYGQHQHPPRPVVSDSDDESSEGTRSEAEEEEEYVPVSRP
jgi:hypothetical protein